MLIYWAALILIPKVDEAARYMATQWGNLAPIVSLLGHLQKNMNEKRECFLSKFEKKMKFLYFYFFKILFYVYLLNL